MGKWVASVGWPSRLSRGFFTSKSLVQRLTRVDTSNSLALAYCCTVGNSWGDSWQAAPLVCAAQRHHHHTKVSMHITPHKPTLLLWSTVTFGCRSRQLLTRTAQYRRCSSSRPRPGCAAERKGHEVSYRRRQAATGHGVVACGPLQPRQLATCLLQRPKHKVCRCVGGMCHGRGGRLWHASSLRSSGVRRRLLHCLQGKLQWVQSGRGQHSSPYTL
jgi:hypothetical protein